MITTIIKVWLAPPSPHMVTASFLWQERLNSPSQPLRVYHAVMPTVGTVLCVGRNPPLPTEVLYPLTRNVSPSPHPPAPDTTVHCLVSEFGFQIPCMCDIIQYSSFLFHLAEYPSSPSMLLQKDITSFFLWLSSIPLCTSRTTPSLSIPLPRGTQAVSMSCCCELGCSGLWGAVSYWHPDSIAFACVWWVHFTCVNAFPTPREQLDKIHLGGCCTQAISKSHL